MNKGPENICLIYDYIFIRVSHFFKLHGSKGSLGIAPSFLKLDLWSPGQFFISIFTKVSHFFLIAWF